MRIVRKVRTSLMVSEEVFRNMRIYATKRGQDISEFAEEALEEKIAQCKELENAQEELTELKATIDVARRLYQQIQQKPDFNSNMSEDFVKTITSGINSRYHDVLRKGITEDSKKFVDKAIERLQEEMVAKITRRDIPLAASSKKSEQSEPQSQNQEERLQEQKSS